MRIQEHKLSKHLMEYLVMLDSCDKVGIWVKKGSGHGDLGKTSFPRDIEAI